MVVRIGYGWARVKSNFPVGRLSRPLGTTIHFLSSNEQSAPSSENLDGVDPGLVTACGETEGAVTLKCQLHSVLRARECQLR